MFGLPGESQVISATGKNAEANAAASLDSSKSKGDHGGTRKTLLFIDYAAPAYDMYAGSRASYNYLRLFAELGLRIFFIPSDFARLEPYSTALEKLGIVVLAGDKYRAGWKNWLVENNDGLDYVVINKPDPGKLFIDAVKYYTKAAVIYINHDLHYLRLHRKGLIEESSKGLQEAAESKNLEHAIFGQSDQVWTFSAVEKDILNRDCPGVEVIQVPLYFFDEPVARVRHFTERDGLLFVGGFEHSPNRDGLLWFINHALHAVHESNPGLVLHVVGANPPPEITSLQSDLVRIHGHINDDQLARIYQRCKLAIVPLRYGAGVKGKAIEALHQGIPMVSTAIGLEGITGINGIYKAFNTASEFAAEVIDLYSDNERLATLSKLGRSFAAAHFSKEHAVKLITSLLSRAEAGTRGSSQKSNREADPKVLAFYLPAFHPIKENDDWWGAGFTEWRNVAKADPLFSGHYQPHIPRDLGFYDLRLHETMVKQADLARNFGIHGFCFYHYWFDGRRLLERPVQQYLDAGTPDFPFCLCWANENWTRRWDGEEDELLVSQTYSETDDRAHIRHLVKYFRDRRYIKIDGKPLFLVYKSSHLPDPKRTANIWQEEVKKAGFAGIYLVRVESMDALNPGDIGFDAAAEFAPDWANKGQPLRKNSRRVIDKVLKPARKIADDHYVHSYGQLMSNMLKKPAPSYTWFRCVAPAWDNTARRKQGAHVFLGSTPTLYQEWLRAAIEDTRSRLSGDEQIVFINAWNEWGEGAHLEPDLKFGRDYLEATLDAVKGGCSPPEPPLPVDSGRSSHEATKLRLFKQRLTNIFYSMRLQKS